MRDHRKLIAFEIADSLVLDIYSVTRGFPKEELFGLTSQMRRASISAVSSIVEGCARRTENDFLHFLEMSFGSLRELEYQIGLSVRLGFVQDGVELQEKCAEALRVLHGLIKSMRE